MKKKNSKEKWRNSKKKNIDVKRMKICKRPVKDLKKDTWKKNVNDVKRVKYWMKTLKEDKKCSRINVIWQKKGKLKEKYYQMKKKIRWRNTKIWKEMIKYELLKNNMKEKKGSSLMKEFTYNTREKNEANESRRRNEKERLKERCGRG